MMYNFYYFKCPLSEALLKFTHHVRLYYLLFKAVITSYSLSNRFLLINTNMLLAFKLPLFTLRTLKLQLLELVFTQRDATHQSCPIILATFYSHNNQNHLYPLPLLAHEGPAGPHLLCISNFTPLFYFEHIFTFLI